MLFTINSAGGYHFDGETLASDKLIITSEGLAYSVALGGLGGNWTATVDGVVFGFFTLAAGSDPGSKITIDRTGLVQNDGTAVTLGSDVTFKNYGQIASGGRGIELDEGNSHVIVNAGTIEGGGYSIIAGSSKDSVTNTGTLKGDVALGDGDDHLITSGGIFGDVSLEDGKDFVKVSGRGFITGTIYLGGGADTLNGGAGSETVTGGAGDDKVNLGGGNDTFNALSDDGNDTINGGGGIDTYDATGVLGSITINLDTVSHNTILANSAWGGVAINPGHDKVFGFENATGGNNGDVLFGSRGGNVLDGGNGSDILFGFGGNDLLRGGQDASDDYLIGGAGRDTLYGGDGPDRFMFNAVTESGVTTATRDVIMDFSHDQGDKIDLSGIDLAPKTTGHQGFHLGTTITEFEGTRGALRAQSITDTNGNVTGVMVEGDVNGDAKADFSILVKCNAALVAGVGGDFIL